MSKYYTMRYDFIFKHALYRDENVFKQLKIDCIRRKVERMNWDSDFFQALTDEEDARMVQESLKREAAR